MLERRVVVLLRQFILKLKLRGGGACIPLGRKSEDLLGKYLVGSGEEMELWKKGERGRANQVMRQPS